MRPSDSAPDPDLFFVLENPVILQKLTDDCMTNNQYAPPPPPTHTHTHTLEGNYIEKEEVDINRK